MLNSSDYIVTAFGERAAGPGWANSPLWVVVRDASGGLRMECVQPEEQSRDIHLLFDLSNTAHRAMVCAVEQHFAGTRKQK